MCDTRLRIPDADVLAAEALPLVAWQARRFAKLPAGMDVEDLESVGNEAIVEEIAHYDPSCGLGFKACARTRIRSRMVDAIRTAKRRAKGRVPLQSERADGTTTPLPADCRSCEPGEIAAARETLTRRKVTPGRVEKSLPSPQVVAAKVVELRHAMFDGVSAEDVREVMASLVAKAKDDLKATRLLLELLAPRMSGVAVQHHSIAVEDLG